MVAPREPFHEACLTVVRSAEPPLVTTWPCFTEAMFVARRRVGWAGEQALWRMVERDTVLLMDLDLEARTRAANLMEKYRDVPMALAGASLVAIAEKLRVDTVFTIDKDFDVYRLNGRRPFHLLP
jgi:predicted nucleic acid-binding protein